MAGATDAAGHAAVEGIGEIVHVLLDVVLPIVLVLAGVFTYSWLGGATSIAGLLTTAKVSTTLANHVAPLIPAAIAFSIGGGFWVGLGSGKGIIVRAIGKLVGSYFIGVGFGYVLNAAFGNPTAGALDSLIGSTSAAVTR